MKKCLVLLLCGMLMMTGCSREMLSHTSKKAMERKVKNDITESFELYEIIDEEDTKDTITYVYYLEDKDIYFKAVSMINEVFVDGSSFGFSHSDNIYYEEAIVSDEKNLNLREEKVEEYGIYDKAYIYENDANFTTAVENYEQLDELAEFLIDMDTIYDFQEDKDISNINRVENELGYMEDGEWKYWFGQILYAANDDEDLFYDQIYAYLEKEYVLMVKRNGVNDPTIPDDVYEKYTEETNTD